MELHVLTANIGRGSGARSRRGSPLEFDYARWALGYRDVAVAALNSEEFPKLLRDAATGRS